MSNPKRKNMAKSVTFKPVDMLIQVAHDNNRPVEAALSDFLDYVLDVFKAENYTTHDSMKSILSEAHDRNPVYYLVMLHWLSLVQGAMENGRWCDFFGNTYELMFQSKSKASRIGQFFTPRSVSDLLGDITASQQENNAPQRINDCCCGSGRLLLSHYMKNSSPQRYGTSVGYYVAQDIDPVSCKMCALNMMAHGMIGEVHCQDTLLMTPPVFSYYINEVRTPFPTPFYSVRRVD